MLKKSVLLAFITVFFVSCSAEKSEQMNLSNEILDLEKSFLIWKEIKINNNSTYTFTSEFISWIGFGNRSKIYVKNDEIIKKEYSSWNSNGKILEKFTERKNNLGNSKKGIIPQKIDDLYEICKVTILRKDKKTNNIYIGYDKKKILKYCLYSPKNCADDCSKGVRIDRIEF
ncbi:hypothetical protein [Arcobacter sp. LA11]|uniref:hypothetical protein n=1 Tax=Arcobacter sp. LA11 TaxID=1898176 RepID=UPI0009324F89|nr:hypothetical protein [Arcobacter sp. LA11]